jgi:hypothetical protein
MMTKMENTMLTKEYLEHKLFNELSEMAEFYDNLSYSVFGWSALGRFNIDKYVMTSIQGTLESIKNILGKGRINDAYALLRKYYDVTVINIYTNLYFEDNKDINNFVVKQTDDWLNGKEKLPEYRIMSAYIKKSDKLKLIIELLQKNDLYKNIRNRCNDHTHYNYYRNLVCNDNKVYMETRVKLLDVFLKDLIAIFVQHLSLLFSIKETYMASSDYIDSLDCGLAPEEDSQYWVTPYIQKAFDKWIKGTRLDIAEIIKKNTNMQLT